MEDILKELKQLTEQLVELETKNEQTKVFYSYIFKHCPIVIFTSNGPPNWDFTWVTTDAIKKIGIDNNSFSQAEFLKNRCHPENCQKLFWLLDLISKDTSDQNYSFSFRIKNDYNEYVEINMQLSKIPNHNKINDSMSYIGFLAIDHNEFKQ